MATFLTTDGIVRGIDRIIQEANRELVLISPYINLDSETKKLLTKVKGTTEKHVIYGKNYGNTRKSLSKQDLDFLGSLNFKASYRKNLHAKCYLNENEVLLTSMNLYQYSQDNNDEMGILVSREKDGRLYDEIHRQAKRWLASSDGIEAAKISKAVSTPRKFKTKRKSIPTVPERGFCIGCKDDLPADPSSPYCRDCYKTRGILWNKKRQANYCHICGKEPEKPKERWPTLHRPLCPDCYKKYGRHFKFITA